jgi:hypothetical protein
LATVERTINNEAATFNSNANPSMIQAMTTGMLATPDNQSSDASFSSEAD